MGQIRCDAVVRGFNSGRQAIWSWQKIPVPAGNAMDEAEDKRGIDGLHGLQIRPASHVTRAGLAREVSSPAAFVRLNP